MRRNFEIQSMRVSSSVLIAHLAIATLLTPSLVLAQPPSNEQARRQELAAQLAQLEQRTYAFHMDKPGQMRVFDASGHELSGVNVQFMRGQLLTARREIANMQLDTAQTRLSQVLTLLN